MSYAWIPVNVVLSHCIFFKMIIIKKLTHFFTDGLHTDFLFWIVAEVVQQDVLWVDGFRCYFQSIFQAFWIFPILSLCPSRTSCTSRIHCQYFQPHLPVGSVRDQSQVGQRFLGTSDLALVLRQKVREVDQETAIAFALEEEGKIESLSKLDLWSFYTGGLAVSPGREEVWGYRRHCSWESCSSPCWSNQRCGNRQSRRRSSRRRGMVLHRSRESCGRGKTLRSDKGSDSIACTSYHTP